MSVAQSRLKFARQFEKTKRCKDCGEEKPLTEFYRLEDRYNSYCKPCHTRRNKSNKQKGYTSPEHELYVVRKLNSMGVPAIHGSELKGFANVDVVAYHNVRIEVKPLNYQHRKDGYGYWNSANTKSQQDNGWLAEVICIVFQDELYFFKPTHPAFYIDGKLRPRILYNPDSKRKHLTTNRKLEHADMALAHNRIELIEYAHRRVMLVEPPPKTVQLLMFPEAS